MALGLLRERVAKQGRRTCSEHGVCVIQRQTDRDRQTETDRQSRGRLLHVNQHAGSSCCFRAPDTDHDARHRLLVQRLPRSPSQTSLKR
eukprot:160029-Rhodomonas_salina.1